MPDIELLIKIPEHCLEELRHIELNESNEGIVFHAIECIVHGTPLSKGHGRLIDADALNLDYEVEMADDWKTAHEIANCVKYAPTIIDKEE